MAKRVFLIVWVLLALSASATEQEKQLLITKIPGKYLLTLSPDDENTILVDSCNRLVTGLPERCEAMGKISVEDMEIFMKDIVGNSAGEEYPEMKAISLLVGLAGVAGGVETFFNFSKMKIPKMVRRVGGTLGVFFGGVLIAYSWSESEREILYGINVSGGFIKGKQNLSLFTDFFNQYGRALD